MRSVRFDEDLENRLERAAEVAGQSVSEVIRDGARKRCDEILGETLYARIKDLIGSVASPPKGRKRTDSRRTGEAFSKLVAEKRARRRKC
jgi:hypothetical protein